MPVIRYIPIDPRDGVIAGEQMRDQAISMNQELPQFADVMVFPWPDVLIDLIAGENEFGMIGDDKIPNREILQSFDQGSCVRTNAVISTPCGAVYPMDVGNHLMNIFMGSTIQWRITGVTKDGSGNPLGGCRVVALEMGKIYSSEQAPAIIAETTSDGSGNYSVNVPLNVCYQLVAYKPDAPDVAGLTVNTIVPTPSG